MEKEKFNREANELRKDLAKPVPTRLEMTASEKSKKAEPAADSRRRFSIFVLLLCRRDLQCEGARAICSVRAAAL